MSDSIDEEILHRHFVAIATSEYDDASMWSRLPGVGDEVASMSGWLCDEELGARRFSPSETQLAESPTLTEIQTFLYSSGTAWTTSDAVVVFVTGHGYRDDAAHWTVLKATEIARINSTAIKTADIMAVLAEKGAEHVMVIFDMCFSGGAAAEIARFNNDPAKSMLVLASATKNEEALVGGLTSAVAEFLAEAATIDKFSHGPYFRVDEFLDAVAMLLPAGQQLVPLHAPLSARRTFSPCLPNPRYRPRFTARYARQDLVMSVEEFAASQSRPILMSRLIEFTAAAPSTMVLTGSAGCGKSSALSWLVSLSDPDFLAEAVEEVADVPDGLRPERGAVDVAVRATRMYPYQVLEKICRGLSVPLGDHDGEGAVPHLLAAWSEWLRSHGRPVTVVVDALDEAKDPEELITDVLSELERRTPLPRQVRLLVGVRSYESDERAPAAPLARTVADFAETKLGAARLRADRPPLWEPTDLATYISRVLVETGGSPLERADPGAVRGFVEVIAEKAGTSFLFANRAATSLAAREQPVDVDDPAWRASLDDDIIGVFRDDLERSFPDQVSRERIVHLLRAVAFAKGRGLPWNRIWPLVTHAVANHPDHTYGDEDVRRLLESRVAGYLVTDTDDDTTVYRLRHDTLRTTLRDRWQDLLPQEVRPAGADQSIEAVEGGIALELSRLATQPRAGRDDLAPQPYLRRHLAEHAHAGGVLTDQVIPDQLLPYVDVVALRRIAEESPVGRAGRGLSLLSVIRKVSHQWDWESPGHNAAALEMWAAVDGIVLPDALAKGSWRVRWASPSRDSGEIIARGAAPVSVVAAATLPDGRSLIVAAGVDPTMRLWDIATGPASARPLVGHSKPVFAAATDILPDGRAVLVSAGGDGTVRVWDLEAATPMGEPFVLELRSLATMILPDGRLGLVAGHDDGSVRVWDIDGAVAVPVGAPLGGHDGPVLAVALLALPGRMAAVTGGDDGTVRRWDLTSGTSVGPPLHGHERPVTAVATAMLPDGRAVAVTGGDDGVARLWNLADGGSVGEPLSGHDGPVTAVAMAVLNGDQAVAVTGGDDTTVRLWHLSDDAATCRVLAGHNRPVTSVTVVTLPGQRVVAVTGSWDATTRRWDLADLSASDDRPVHEGLATALATAVLPEGLVALTSRDDQVWVGGLADDPSRRSLVGHDRPVLAVATTTVPGIGAVAVTGSWDTTVRVWRLDTAEPLGQPYGKGHGPVMAVAVADLPGLGRVVVAASWHDARVWNLLDGTPACAPLVGHSGPVRCVATAVLGDGRVVAVSGGDDGTVRCWDLVDGAPVGEPLVGHVLPVRCVATAVLGDGRVVAVSGGGDGTVRCWDLADGAPIGVPLPCPVAVTAVSVVTADSGGPSVALAGNDFLAHVDLPTGPYWWPSSQPQA
ncbi:hypothetical protein Lfu02_36410 [Longispora fulva]|uniref:caspase family protein n=1 Tax=Longispora fulva TaxID=619741 RepID=UPI0019418970|nr:caspase family protein [Longispora fulva]GIG59269.1 hypothetical protein Lfu02_36410 [Longispora fulva]